jgi:hypothetical protein
VRLLYEDAPLPGRFHFVCHAVREIRNTLPHLIGGTKISTVQYVNKLDQIGRDWARYGLPMDRTFLGADLSEPNSGINIPLDLFDQISGLISEHQAARRRPVDLATNMFLGLAPENSDFVDQMRPIVIHWINVTKWFQERVHVSLENSLTDIDSEFVNKFEQFERVLGGLVRGFFSTTDEIDEILRKANS